jgi:hypothetical protein
MIKRPIIFVCFVLFAACSARTAVNEIPSNAAVPVARTAIPWGVQITAEATGAVGVFQFAVCDSKVIRAGKHCYPEYNNAPFVRKQGLSNHAADRMAGCSSTHRNGGYGSCGVAVDVSSDLGAIDIKGATSAAPPSTQQGGSTADLLYADPAFTDDLTIESSTLARGTPVNIKSVLTLEVLGGKQTCKAQRFADVTAGNQITSNFSTVVQYTQTVSGRCTPSVWELTSQATGGTSNPGTTTGSSLSITSVTSVAVGSTGPIIAMLYYQTGSSAVAGGTRATTNVTSKLTWHLEAATKGVTLKLASGHKY